MEAEDSHPNNGMLPSFLMLIISETWKLPTEKGAAIQKGALCNYIQKCFPHIFPAPKYSAI